MAARKRKGQRSKSPAARANKKVNGKSTQSTTTAAATAWYAQWESDNPEKRWTERCFLVLAAGWITMFAVIIGTAMYERFAHVGYLVVCSAMALPYAIVPYFLAPPAVGATKYWVKANVWIAVFSYIGNFYWTHYFYTLLGARYTFESWRLNDVPIPMYLATHAYFCFYHSVTNMCLRRLRRSRAYARGGRAARLALDSALVALLAYVTAFMETKTIEGFPYWEFEDRASALRVGSCVYGLYFVVSFPMFVRIDEDPRRDVRDGDGHERWTVTACLHDALACGMGVTCLLDVWRLAFGAVFTGGAAVKGEVVFI